MTTRAQRRKWLDAVAAELDERDGALGYQLRQGEARRGKRGGRGRPGPLQFDARGFPVPQPGSGFERRVGRLISGD